MTQTNIYRRKRDFTVLDVVGLCAMTKEELVAELFNIPTSPVSASFNLVGIPAVNLSIEDNKIANMYNSATITTIDGMPIVKIARKKGFHCERCSGPDIMGMVFEESIKQSKTHYFYGGNDDNVLKLLRGNLEQDYPGINIVGMYSPPFHPITDKEDEKICDEINRLKPDFLWVGIGAPKQEIWIMNHRNKVYDCVMLGVGAAFNFLAGTLDKAPKWIENCCMEWLFRLCKEPKRMWRRSIIGGFKILYYSAISRLSGNRLIKR